MLDTLREEVRKVAPRAFLSRLTSLRPWLPLEWRVNVSITSLSQSSAR